MIYLKRGTEIAVLERIDSLLLYALRGYSRATEAEYFALWRAKSMAASERVPVPHPAAPPTLLCCPECSCDKIVVFVGGQRRCRRCQNSW